MYLYRKEDRFDTKTGKQLAPSYVECGVICDFTGERFECVEDCGPNIEISYNSLDPSAGNGFGEYEFAKKHKIDIHGFLFSSPYHFSDGHDDFNRTTLEQILEAAEKEGFDRMYFDQLFRWCRIRTADALLSAGTYTKEELGMEQDEYYNEEDESDEFNPDGAIDEW